MDDAPTGGFREQPVWLVAAAVVVVAQAGLALGLFGTGRQWAAVTDDRPIVSGRHPLHLYHGTLGAAAFRDHRNATCYDPAFQAGYPKTPVFDGGSRPAELFALAGGPGYRPAAYKTGVLVFLMLIPGAFIAAARGAGLPAGPAVLTGCFGVLLAWCPAVRAMLEDGQLDLLGAGLAAAVFVPWLGRYARYPGPEPCLVLAGLALAGWYAHPLVWVGLLPVMLVFYLVFAPHHGPGWHLGLAGVVSFGVVPNAWWLIDWKNYWWLQQPSSSDHIPLPPWEAVLGAPADYAALCAGLPGGAVVPLVALGGLVLLWAGGHRAAAWLSLLTAVLAVCAARLAATWPRVPPEVPTRVAPFALALLTPAAAFGVWEVMRRARAGGAGVALCAAALFLVGWADGPGAPLANLAGVRTQPFLLGLTPEQQRLVDALREHTTPAARILWEEAGERSGGNWSVLLPLYTGRAFLGGLDTDSEIDHGYCGLRNQCLSGRPLAEWTDKELSEFCRWYNVGWVVCRTPGTAERWARCAEVNERGEKRPLARAVARFTENGQPVVLLALDRPLTFVLDGRAVLESADAKRIVLTNVEPNALGYVDLSFHHFEGLHPHPSYLPPLLKCSNPVTRDPVDHIRIWMPGPVPRIVLVWEHP
ncbi:hypothetical protein R5W23_000709 [Gemmata sp. JC673]|uniref:Glycosyltransferase RgtA/B/C/D-like domain-containing protein n=1 Tax=Gemmata algarum TaxID=2975278 RepID=A0ABU5EYZ0_9BACT|nr:hypothetical protein [Gemmata algarum]MDY3559695.1 hypothetical protein [Gemmata algarum]